MWERNLQDLIRGLRAHKGDESRFIASAIDEIRTEVRSDDMELKAAAVLKLTYLEMLGYDMSWASFHVVEVMSSSRFHLKSMGYLAATQSFEQDTDVLMLTTNLLKKDLTSSKHLDVAVSLNGLAHIVTPDLGRDLSRDIISLLTHSRASVRKRAVLALYKVFVKYPESIEYGIERLKDRLEDPDIGVVCAVVSVLCELARQNPQNYLIFAPPLFHIMTTSSNNWMLIKIIKLFGLLTPYEPRLIKKLQPPITDLISTTPAISLLYECVHTCIIGGMLQGISGHTLAQTCVTKLAAFLEDPDQNLKYISLLALAKIVPSHPHLLAEYESRILSSIDDQDLSIRMRALDLVSAMVNQNNLPSIVQQLLSHLVKPDATPSAAQSLSSAANSNGVKYTSSPMQSIVYRTVLAQRILSMCSHDLYSRVADFEWYVSVLVDLAYVARAPVGAIIRDQLVDVVSRVREVRRYAVQVCLRILGDESFTFAGADADGGSVDSEGAGCQEVLWAAAFICGEYADLYSDTRKIIPTLLSRSTLQLKPDIIAVYIQSAAKIFGSWAAELGERWDDDELPELRQTVETILDSLSNFASNSDFEVQERAANFIQLFKFLRADLSSYRPKPKSIYGNGFSDASTSAFDPVGVSEPDFPKSLYLLKPLFSSYPLNPVAEEAQQSIPVPEGLDLDTWIVPRMKPREPERGSEISEDKIRRKRKKDRKGKGKEIVGEGEVAGSRGSSRKGNDAENGHVSEQTRLEQEELAKAKARRLEMLRDDPYYIIDDRPKAQDPIDVDLIPVVKLDDLPPLDSTPDTTNLRFTNRPSASPQVSYTIDRSGEMPPEATVREKSSTPPIGPNSISRSATPARSMTPAMPPSSFPQYEYDEEVHQPKAPELVKVTRVKKGTGKKKRNKDIGSAHVEPTVSSEAR